MFLYQFVGEISTYYVSVKDWFLTHVGFWGYMVDYTCVRNVHQKKFKTSVGPQRNFFIQVISYEKVSNRIFRTAPKCLPHLQLELLAILYPQVK